MSEECRKAFQVALELIEEKCGISFSKGTRKVEISGATLTVPPEIEKIATENPELTREERIKAISETSWALGWARGVCRMVTGEATPECVDRMARRLAERVV